jgi:dipeptidyl aminopeptidase/acylaminoacyl peptidase
MSFEYWRDRDHRPVQLPTVPDRVSQASPLSHVRAGAPPFLLLHGQ